MRKPKSKYIKNIFRNVNQAGGLDANEIRGLGDVEEVAERKDADGLQRIRQIHLLLILIEKIN